MKIKEEQFTVFACIGLLCMVPFYQQLWMLFADYPLQCFVVIGLIMIFLKNLIRWTPRNSDRKKYIEDYVFSETLKEKFRQKQPHLSDEEVDNVFLILKDFFIFSEREKRLAMPSKVVDDAWHEFILFTKDYQNFCEKAFGCFLHHQPSEKFEKDRFLNKGKKSLRSVWLEACLHEKIDPASPHKLPRLFAIDKLLGIEGGYFYTHLQNSSDNVVSASKIKCSIYFEKTEFRPKNLHDNDSSNKFGGCGGDCGGCGGE